MRTLGLFQDLAEATADYLIAQNRERDDASPANTRTKAEARARLTAVLHESATILPHATADKIRYGLTTRIVEGPAHEEART